MKGASGIRTNPGSSFCVELPGVLEVGIAAVPVFYGLRRFSVRGYLIHMKAFLFIIRV